MQNEGIKLDYRPGVYRQVPDERYRRIKAISKSDLDKWAGGDSPDPRVALVGHVFHAAILEPEIARERVVVCPHRRNSKAWAEFEAEHHKDGGWVLTKGEFEQVKGCVDGVKGHSLIADVRKAAMADRDKTEIVVVWEDEKTGLLCKAKIDQETSKCIIDWKSTGMFDSDGSPLAMARYGYGAQAAHYSAGWLAATGIELPMRFIFASKRADKGNPCWVYTPTEAELAAGRRSLDQLLHLYAKYATQGQGNERASRNGCTDGGAGESPAEAEAPPQELEEPAPEE